MFVPHTISAFILSLRHILSSIIASISYFLDGFMQPVIFLHQTAKNLLFLMMHANVLSLRDNGATKKKPEQAKCYVW